MYVYDPSNINEKVYSNYVDKKLCYLCVKEAAVYLNPYPNEEQLSYADKLKYLYDECILPPSDVPLWLCTKCSGGITNAYIFKVQCLNTFNFWRSYFESSNRNKTCNSDTCIDNVKIKIEPEIELIEGDKPYDENHFSSCNFDAVYIKSENINEENCNELSDKNVKTVEQPKSIVSETNEYDFKLNKFVPSSNKTLTSDANETQKDNSINHPISVGENSKHDSDVASVSSVKSTKETDLKLHMLTPPLNSPFNCELCPKSFKTKYLRKLHMKFHLQIKNHVCDMCGKSFVQKCNLNKHRKIHDKKKHKCEVCQKSFVTNQGLKTHMLEHNPDKQSHCTHKRQHNNETFKCNPCGNTYSSKQELKRDHQRHNNERNFPCTVCEKRFFTKQQLENHLRIHSDDRPFTCQYCAKTFKQRGTLLTHIRGHTNHRPYKCKFCDKSFIKSHHCNFHMEKHHDSTDKFSASESDSDINSDFEVKCIKSAKQKMKESKIDLKE